MAGNFDPDVFLGLTVDKELDTKTIPIPPGTYPGVIEDVKPKLITSNNTGEEYLIFEVFFRIDDESVKQATGRDKPRTRMSIFVDRTESGGIDVAKGKNIQLGKLRDAVNQNNPGQPWAPSMLKGAACRIKVGHRKDPNSGDMYDEVQAVTKL
jgi:hypothetical protein